MVVTPDLTELLKENRKLKACVRSLEHEVRTLKSELASAKRVIRSLDLQNSDLRRNLYKAKRDVHQYSFSY